MFCKFGENFAVDGDVFLFHCTHELAVRNGVTEGGIDFDGPQFAEVIFLISSVCERIRTSVKDSFLSHLLFGGATETVAFHLSQHILARL